MVVFIDGQPKPQEYRRFRIKTVVGANDFASMAEVLGRRFRERPRRRKLPGRWFGGTRAPAKAIQAHERVKAEAWATLPTSMSRQARPLNPRWRCSKPVWASAGGGPGKQKEL